MARGEATRRLFWSTDLVAFDFDGVIIDSNELKSDCFLRLSRHLNSAQKQTLLTFLEHQPAATRFEVVDLICSIKKDSDVNFREELLKEYSECTLTLMKRLTPDPDLKTLRYADDRPWAVVSATASFDLFRILDHFELTQTFNAGVFGSPRNKLAHLVELRRKPHGSKMTGVYVGDRYSDLNVANEAGYSFIFASRWSDASLEDRQKMSGENSIVSLRDLLMEKSSHA